MPSRVPHRMVIGRPRSRSRSSSARRSARRARLATRTIARGLRTRLGTKSSNITGRTRVACRTGHTSLGKCSPQSHNGRSPMLRSVRAAAPRRSADRVDQHQRAHPRSGMSWAKLDGNAATEGVTDQHGRLVDLQHVEQVGDPLGVPAHRERLAVEIAAATEAGHRRGDHHSNPARRSPRSPAGTCAAPAPSRAAAPPACLRRRCCTPRDGPAPRCVG